MNKLSNSLNFIILAFLLSLPYQSLYSQNFSSPNKLLSIKGYSPGKIPISILKKATQLDIKAPFVLKSSNVYFSSDIGKDVSIISLHGNIFDKEFLRIWYRVRVNTTITFDNIKILKDGNIIDLVGATYEVVED